MKTRELLIVMGTLGSTFVPFTDGQRCIGTNKPSMAVWCAFLASPTKTCILEEGRGWVKPNQASKPRAQYPTLSGHGKRA